MFIGCRDSHNRCRHTLSVLDREKDFFDQRCVWAVDLERTAFDACVDLRCCDNWIVMDKSESVADQSLGVIGPLQTSVGFHPPLNRQSRFRRAFDDKCISDNLNTVKVIDLQQRLSYNRIVGIISHTIPPVNPLGRRACAKNQKQYQQKSYERFVVHVSVWFLLQWKVCHHRCLKVSKDMQETATGSWVYSVS